MEKISAFMDGEIAGAEASGQLNRLKEDAGLRAAWGTYHAIGDAMRGEKVWLSPDFGVKVMARLMDEPTVLAPHRRALSQTTLRRYALPVAASFGGIALVAWLALFNNPFAPTTDNLAVVAPVKVEAPTRVVSDVNDYLMAHQQVSSSATLQGVVSYVRPVSGDTEEKR